MPEDKSINHIFTKTSPEMKRRLEAIPVGKRDFNSSTRRNIKMFSERIKNKKNKLFV